METQSRLVPPSRVVVENQGECLGYAAAPEECGVPAPYQAAQPRAPVLGSGVPRTPGCEISRHFIWVRWRAALDPDVL